MLSRMTKAASTLAAAARVGLRGAARQAQRRRKLAQATSSHTRRTLVDGGEQAALRCAPRSRSAAPPVGGVEVVDDVDAADEGDAPVDHRQLAMQSAQAVARRRTAG
jgi:hypothetical protein